MTYYGCSRRALECWGPRSEPVALENCTVVMVRLSHTLRLGGKPAKSSLSSSFGRGTLGLTRHSSDLYKQDHGRVAQLNQGGWSFPSSRYLPFQIKPKRTRVYRYGGLRALSRCTTHPSKPSSASSTSCSVRMYRTTGRGVYSKYVYSGDFPVSVLDGGLDRAVTVL